MKLHFKHSLAASALAVTLLIGSASAKPVKVTITKSNDTVVTGFVVKGDAKTLYVSPQEAAPTGAPIPQSQIVNIYWEEPDDWKAAWKLWVSRDYTAGAKAFETLAKSYSNLAAIEDSFGSRAKYYQGECLRRSGQYSPLMEVYDQVKQVSLSGGYQKQIQLFNYWGHVGKKLWEPLRIVTDRFSLDASSVPDHTVPPTAFGLKEIETELMVQVAYMRGISNEMIARKEHKKVAAVVDSQVPETVQAAADAWAKVRATMSDYSRVFTLTYGSDRLMSKQAMERCMGILKDDPDIKESYQMKKEAYALASFYKDLFGKGTVPKEFTDFLKEPKPPEGASKKQDSADKKAAAPAKKDAKAPAKKASAKKKTR